MYRILTFYGLLATAALAHGGTFIEVDRYNQDGERDSTVTLHVQDGKLRVDQIDEEQMRSGLIYDGERVVELNISERTYALIERERVERAKKKLDPRGTLRAELLAEVPAERRGDSMRILSTPRPSSAEIIVRPTARARRELGMTCRVFEVRQGQQLGYEFCMHEGEQQPQLREFMQAREGATALLSEFFRVLDMPVPQAVIALQMAPPHQAKGVALWSHQLNNGKTISEFRVSAVRSQEIDASVFQIPAGLNRRAVLDFTAPAPTLEAHEEE
jgi:hypothetical protein